MLSSPKAPSILPAGMADNPVNNCAVPAEPATGNRRACNRSVRPLRSITPLPLFLIRKSKVSLSPGANTVPPELKPTETASKSIAPNSVSPKPPCPPAVLSIVPLANCPASLTPADSIAPVASITVENSVPAPTASRFPATGKGCGVTSCTFPLINCPCPS